MFLASSARKDAGRPIPALRITRRRLLVIGMIVVAIASFEYVVLPQLAGLEETWGRARNGDARWLVAAAAFQVLAFASYVTLFRAVIRGSGLPIGWRESYLISMAGLVAARVFAAAGAGGIALTAWALHRLGMGSHRVVAAITSFLVLLYAVYMSSLVAVGLGLSTGVLSGDAPLALTVPPAVFGASAILAVLAIAIAVARPHAPGPPSTRPRGSVAARLADRARSGLSAVAAGVREAVSLVRARSAGMLGALGWWAFDILVLWACFRAFGAAPPGAVIVLAYFLGMFGNLLPLPGGVGGVEGGMIAAFIALGVEEGLAIVAVLVYRASAFWLPTIPGALAYLQLRRAIGDWRAEGPGS